MKHVFFTIEGCDSAKLDNEQYVVDTLQEAVHVVNATLLKISSHKFEPHGVTAVALLSESHISIHSWPELNKAACDIFTCGQHTTPEKGIEFFQNKFSAAKVSDVKIVNRGDWDAVCDNDKAEKCDQICGL